MGTAPRSFASTRMSRTEGTSWLSFTKVVFATTRLSPMMWSLTAMSLKSKTFSNKSPVSPLSLIRKTSPPGDKSIFYVPFLLLCFNAQVYVPRAHHCGSHVLLLRHDLYSVHLDLQWRCVQVLKPRLCRLQLIDMRMTLGPSQVVVLDYTTRLTHVFTYPEGTEDIALWVEETHGINMNNAYHMT